MTVLPAYLSIWRSNDIYTIYMIHTHGIQAALETQISNSQKRASVALSVAQKRRSYKLKQQQKQQSAASKLFPESDKGKDTTNTNTGTNTGTSTSSSESAGQPDPSVSVSSSLSSSQGKAEAEGASTGADTGTGTGSPSGVSVNSQEYTKREIVSREKLTEQLVEMEDSVSESLSEFHSHKVKLRSYLPRVLADFDRVSVKSELYVWSI